MLSLLPHNRYKLRKFECIGCHKNIELNRSSNNTQYCSLECYRNSKRPNRITGKIIKCEYCSKEVYKCKTFLTKNKNLFCSKDCSNKFQGKNKLIFICKICNSQFRWSKSRIKDNNPTYCSIQCRNKDDNWKFFAIRGNLIQQQKKGLNKLELAGQKILKDLGIIFKEQILIGEKFLVDVFIPDKNIIIQWDGDYWHNKAKRKLLDLSQDSYMKKCGYNVIRFWESEVKKNPDIVKQKIKEIVLCK